jgi:hypothetical protein
MAASRAVARRSRDLAPLQDAWTFGQQPGADEYVP